METQEEKPKSIINNNSTKTQPGTTILGRVIASIGVFMGVLQFIVTPILAIWNIKLNMGYPWYAPLIPLLIGLFFMYMNESYFRIIFKRVNKVSGKVTGTGDIEDDKI